MITGVHVDNFLAIADTESAIQTFKKEMASVWTIADLRTPRHILDIAVSWDRENHKVHLLQMVLIDRLI